MVPTIGASTPGGSKKARDLSLTELNELRSLISKILQSKPGSQAKEIRAALGVPKATINSVLYASSDLFACTEEVPPRWRLAGEVPAADEPRDDEAPDADVQTSSVSRTELNRLIELQLRSNGSSTATELAERLQLPEDLVSRHLFRFPQRYAIDPSTPGRWRLT